MKLTNFKELWSTVRLFDVGMIANTELLLFQQDGLDTDLDDVIGSDNGELITIMKDGTVRKTMAYISERPAYYDNRGWAYPKYHIYDCQTMQTMRKNERGHRYKKTMRDDGSFFMLITYDTDKKSEKIDKELSVCGYCFKEYKEDYKDGVFKKEFKVKDYLEKPINNATPFIEIPYDYTTVPRFYSKNWKQVSSSIKKQLNYTCQECGLKLEGINSKYLHTHHMDGNPSRNIISNLKVVCIECHSNEYSHAHLKDTHDYKKFMQIKKGL